MRISLSPLRGRTKNRRSGRPARTRPRRRAGVRASVAAGRRPSTATGSIPSHRRARRSRSSSRCRRCRARFRRAPMPDGTPDLPQEKSSSLVRSPGRAPSRRAAHRQPFGTRAAKMAALHTGGSRSVATALQMAALHTGGSRLSRPTTARRMPLRPCRRIPHHPPSQAVPAQAAHRPSPQSTPRTARRDARAPKTRTDACASTSPLSRRAPPCIRGRCGVWTAVRAVRGSASGKSPRFPRWRRGAARPASAVRLRRGRRTTASAPHSPRKGPEAARVPSGWLRRRCPHRPSHFRRCRTHPHGACRGASRPVRPSNGPRLPASDAAATCGIRNRPTARARSPRTSRAAPSATAGSPSTSRASRLG